MILGTGLAVALVLLLIIPKYIHHPTKIEYTQQEIIEAHAQVQWSLAYAAKTINQTNQKVVRDVFLNRLPGTVRKGIDESVPIFKGGQ